MKKKTAYKLAPYHIREVQKLLPDFLLVRAYLDRLSIAAPKATEEIGFTLRVTSPDWWARKLIAKALKDAEAKRIVSGEVARGRQVYCSDDSVAHFLERQKATLATMENQVLVSDDGDEIDMLQILQSSIANPQNRRAELMVRMAGFEQYADDNGHQGVFFTITCPSKYHRYSGHGLNENYAHTPKLGQKYLTTLWAQIRAKIDRQGFTPYGFRVSEPHHDGTPHWHMLLFMPPEHIQPVTDIIRHYALLEDGAEQGASEHRFTAKAIVKEIITKDGVKRVSATGYMAKYIAKNIGFDIGDDSEEQGATTFEVAHRVRAWASLWAIRQFQQIGGAPVTVWRELRRLRDDEIPDATIRVARDCCIANDWAGFLDAMGGVYVPRAEREIQLLKKSPVDPLTGEILLNRYREVVMKVVGIATQAIDLLTHLKHWSIVLKTPRQWGEGRACAA